MKSRSNKFRSDSEIGKIRDGRNQPPLPVKVALTVENRATMMAMLMAGFVAKAGSEACRASTLDLCHKLAEQIHDRASQ